MKREFVDNFCLSNSYFVFIPTSTVAFGPWCPGTLPTNLLKNELNTVKQHNHFVASFRSFSLSVASIYISPISLPQFLLKSKL